MPENPIEGLVTPPAPPPAEKKVEFDKDFIADLDKKISYKIAKKVRESRELIKKNEANPSENEPQNVNNISHETKNKWLNRLAGLGFLTLAGLCIYKVIKNVKKSQ